MSGTTNDPIEPDYEPVFLGRYSGYWQDSKTGNELVEWEKFPKIAPADPIRRRSPRLKAVPTPKDKKSIITCRTLSCLTLIPSRQTAEKIRDGVDKLGTQKPYLEVPGFGIFSFRAVYFLQHIYQAVDFSKDLLEMGYWLSTTVKQFDQLFVNWFRNVLFEEPGITSKKFKVTSEVDLSIQGALRCRDKKYLDDDIIRAMFALFDDYYGSNGEYIFIHPTHMTLWLSQLASGSSNPGPWLVRPEAVSNPNIKRAFFVMSKPGHFGALEVDFEKNTISTGDSLGLSFQPEIVLCVEKWIQVCTSSSRTWTRRIGEFNVPRQPPESGSCAVNSLNAIEYSINPKVGYWSHERSAYYRTRILKLVTGFMTLDAETYPQFPAESRSESTNFKAPMSRIITRAATRSKAKRVVGDATGMEATENKFPKRTATRAMTTRTRKGSPIKMRDTAVEAIKILTESSNDSSTDTEAPYDGLTKTATATISKTTKCVADSITFADDKAQPMTRSTNTSVMTTYKFIPRTATVTAIKKPLEFMDITTKNPTDTSPKTTSTLSRIMIDTTYKTMTDTSNKATYHQGKTSRPRQNAADFFADINKQAHLKRRRSDSDAASSESEYETASEFEDDPTMNPIARSERTRKVRRVHERISSTAPDTLESLPLSSSNQNISLSHQEFSPVPLDNNSWEPTFHYTFSDYAEAEEKITRWAISKG
ncbi:hypothetical protein BGZ83_001961, partial [Gryganskiella cystojenkinii]